MKLLLFVLTLVALILGPAMLDVANAAPAPVWLSPSGITCPQQCKTGNLDHEAPLPTHIGLDTGIWRSEGYDPGAEWPTRAFACSGQKDPNGWQTVWHGFDDDHVAGGVKFARPITISGFQYVTEGSSGGPPPYAHFLDLFLSADGTHWTQVAHITDSLKLGVWTPERTTFPAVTANYLYWFSEDAGTWPTVGLAKVLADPSTPRAC